MKPGSVIVDMAAGQGGNVEGSVAGERIVSENGVVILGYTDLPARLPAQASQLYATNLLNLIKLLTKENDGQLTIDFEDAVQRSVTVVHKSEVTWPPPPVHISAATTSAAETTLSRERTTGKPAQSKQPRASTKAVLSTAGIAALFCVNMFAPAPLPQHFTVLLLSIVVGFYVIGKVHHALHTPLMSVTNAISGIIVIGALLQVTSSDLIMQILASAAILLASINIFGGFAVTRRMLAMFSKTSKQMSNSNIQSNTISNQEHHFV